MSKKPKPLSSIGDIRKPERNEPVAKPAPKEGRGRGRPAERVPYVQLNTRVKLTTSEQIDAIAQSNGWTIREVIERAIEELHDK